MIGETPEKNNSSNQSPYPTGEISKRLSALKAAQVISQSSFDKLEPYRQAASVMVAINPATINPVGSVGDGLSGIGLLPELIPSPYSQWREAFPFTLSVATRKATLKSLSTRKSIMSAINANPIRPDTVLQNTFIKVIQGNNFDISQLKADELAAFSTVTDWLEGTDLAKDMPSTEMLRQRINRQRDQDKLLNLTGDSFTGREKEIKTVLSHLVSNEPRILLIYGLGGVGKSALLSKVLLSWIENKDINGSSQNTWVRIDLDHSLVEPERPSTLLREAAAQLARQHPDFITILEDFINDAAKTEARIDYSKMESNSSMDWSQTGLERLTGEFIRILKLGINGPNNRLVFWVDTFEEAQFLGKSVVVKLLNFIVGLVHNTPNIRVILSGRTQLEPGISPDFPIDYLPLGDLPPNAASTLLGTLVRKVNIAQHEIDNTVITRAVKKLGGNPLTLQLAARVIAAEGQQSLINLGKMKKEVLQRQLYSRILEHIHNPDLQKLAVPGLVVRQITPSVIIQVLAVPCGLGQINENKAEQLMEEFGKEITLVDEDLENKSLRYRQDIRQLTLSAMPREMNLVICQIDELAVEFWQKRPGISARAEEIYHRLRLKHPISQLADRWDPAAAPLLRSTLDELPVNSAQRIWLAGMLNAVVDDSSLEMASQTEWEQQAAIEAQRHLVEGKPQKAIDILQKRSKRILGSKLYAIESRAHLFLGNSKKAISKAWVGITACRDGQKDEAVDLALLVAYINERNRNFHEAFEAVDAASEIAKQSGKPILKLSSGLRQLRLQRVSQLLVKQTISKASLIALASDIGPNILASHPSLLRELAAELGQDEPEFIRWASNILLEELLQPMPNEELINTLRNIRSIAHAEEEWMIKADHVELLKLAKHRIEELLYSELKNAPNALNFVQGLFQKSVNDILHKEFLPEQNTETTKIVSVSNPSILDQDSKISLVDIIAEYPQDILHRITRYQLRADFATISQGKDSHSTAAEIVNRAIKLGKVTKLVEDLEQSASSETHKSFFNEIKKLMT
jgi:hypothetical protein